MSTKTGLEIRTTNLYQGFMWKQGKIAKGWVRRLFVLIRREQIDELDDSASNILHELCYFETDSSHSECLGSVILEEVVRFEIGADAGLPEHEKPAFALKKKIQKAEKKSVGQAGLMDALIMLLTANEVDDLEDWTILLSLPNRQLRLRAETKTNFDSWVSILTAKIPLIRAKIMFEGWMWRRMSIGVAWSWSQRYALIYEGVLYFFMDKEYADKFKLLAARDADSVFLASQVSEDMLSLEYCVLTRHDIWEDRAWVLQFKIEDYIELTSVVDEAQSTAWVLAVRSARNWFEKIPDEHPTRKLVGGTNAAEEEGPMIEQNVNPLAAVNADGSVSESQKEANAAQEGKKAADEAAERARIKDEKAKARRELRKQRRENRLDGAESARGDADAGDLETSRTPRGGLMSPEEIAAAQQQAAADAELLRQEEELQQQQLQLQMQQQQRLQEQAQMQQMMQQQQMQQQMQQQQIGIDQYGQPIYGATPSGNMTMQQQMQMQAMQLQMQQMQMNSSQPSMSNLFMQQQQQQQQPQQFPNGSFRQPTMNGMPMGMGMGMGGPNQFAVLSPSASSGAMLAAEPRHPSIKPLGSASAVPGVRSSLNGAFVVESNLPVASSSAVPALSRLGSRVPAGLLPFLSAPVEQARQ